MYSSTSCCAGPAALKWPSACREPPSFKHKTPRNPTATSSRDRELSALRMYHAKSLVAIAVAWHVSRPRGAQLQCTPTSASGGGRERWLTWERMFCLRDSAHCSACILARSPATLCRLSKRLSSDASEAGVAPAEAACACKGAQSTADVPSETPTVAVGGKCKHAASCVSSST